jgi:trehalose/maltose hydrolase-like predicted phosphorylase
VVTTGCWWLDVPEEPGEERVNAARLAIGDGWLGTQAVSEAAAPPGTGGWTANAVRMSGLYGPEPPGELLSAPAWTPLGWPVQGLGWRLDLRQATVSHRLRLDSGATSSRRWAQVDEPGAQVFHSPAVPPVDGASAGAPPGLSFLEGMDGRVGALAVGDRRDGDGLLRVAVARIGRDRGLVGRAACEARDRLLTDGPDELTAEQRRGWTRRWSSAGVSIGGDPSSEVRVRYVLYQLLSMSACPPELAVGARGLTGPGYLGHVFWDADVFVLPALASLAPAAAAAEAMVDYRLNRLDAARSAAAAGGGGGARYPWESAASGRDVTPRCANAPTGEMIEIGTGDFEIHISADVCWAILQYVQWTGHDDLLAGRGGEAIREVARWWASRAEPGSDGRAHLRNVIGPDEYHEAVDDNAFTNQMARWILRRAAALGGDGTATTAGEPEMPGWEQVAETLVDGYRPDLGRHEQFDGYDSLDSMLAETIAPVPFPADLLLGRGRVQRSQLIKQADVLMLHHMIPEAMPPGSGRDDLDHYLPRTSHGSSLSPAVHAGLLAAAGRPDEALGWFRMALALDLDDLTGTTAGGIHIANVGGAWQALLGGFLGVRARPAGLTVDPSLPAAWSHLNARFTYRQAAVEVRATHRQVTVEASSAIPLIVGGDAPVVTSGLRLAPVDRGWVRR